MVESQAYYYNDIAVLVFCSGTWYGCLLKGRRKLAVALISAICVVIIRKLAMPLRGYLPRVTLVQACGFIYPSQDNMYDSDGPPFSSDMYDFRRVFSHVTRASPHGELSEKNVWYRYMLNSLVCI